VQHGVEIEIKLVAGDATVLDELAGLDRLASYSLRPAPTLEIRDRYWDTPDGQLRACRFSLRIREQAGGLWLTAKGPGTIEDGLARHSELELPADAAGWQTVCRHLERSGVVLSAARSDGNDPAAWLTAAGLVVTQERCTNRRVMLASRDGRDVAELALDVTTYHLGIYEVVFREIEAESLSGETRHVLAIGEALQARFGERVAVSDRNKYARGLELARRLA
jgi:inorganic triphosphatase YgiF